MITIVTPVFNGEKYIESCLQTVIAQNCSKIEHLIIDGGSTDNTVNIVKKYAQKHSHIRWISERDRGQSDAMNKGIQKATGEILTFLNVDDYYEPNVLNQVIERFKTLPEPSFVVGNCRIWNDRNQVIDLNKPTKLRLLDLVVGLNINPYPCNPCAYFYHRSLHDRVGDYAIDDHHAMDLDFILRAVQVAHMQYVDQIWGNYRRIEGTKTYIAMADGSADQRVRDLLRKYRRQLTPIEWIEWCYWRIWSQLKSITFRVVRKLLRLIPYCSQ
ncbi:glycosyltransferase [Pseudanabaenaceae cyanobacterium LEGE 13415]|nr:glycosyltransferase [Pseudanabaenaceae cyanobacterium LEGE 13415]